MALKKLDRQIKKFDFEAALETVRTIIPENVEKSGAAE